MRQRHHLLGAIPVTSLMNSWAPSTTAAFRVLESTISVIGFPSERIARTMNICGIIRTFEYPAPSTHFVRSPRNSAFDLALLAGRFCWDSAGFVTANNKASASDARQKTNRRTGASSSGSTWPPESHLHGRQQGEPSGRLSSGIQRTGEGSGSRLINCPACRGAFLRRKTKIS